MNLDLLFPTPIWSVETSICLDDPIQKCLELEATTKKVANSNAGGFQSNFIDWDTHKEFLNCKNIIVSHLQKIIKELEIKSVLFTDFWVNINRKGNFNTEHVHPNSFLSGCLYLKVPEDSGKIFFKRPDAMEHYVSSINSPIFLFKNFYKPYPGLLLLFPSWLSHYVEPSNSDEPRISIAFNIQIREGL